MTQFNYISEARAIRDALAGEEFATWRSRLAEAIDTGFSGTQILMAVRWNLTELLKEKPELPATLVSRIKEYIKNANKLLS